MSGGSYNYLCYADFPDICSKISDLEDMRDRLLALGYMDSAEETEGVILMIKSFRVRIEARIKRLNEIWQAVEWKDSGDWGMENIEEAIKKYRDG